MDSNDGADEASYDIGVLSITVKANEVLANVMFHTRRPNVIRGKIDTGVMVTCMPFSMVCDVGLDEKDIAPKSSQLQGMMGTDMKTRGELTVRVSCNSHSKQIRILVTELGPELILGFYFCKLFSSIAIANACIQRNITFYE